MDMILNKLPSRTWNHLGVNESFLNIEDNLENFIPECDINFKILKDSKIDIKTGMGKDIDSLSSDSDILFINNEIINPKVLKFDYRDNDKKKSRIFIEAKENETISLILYLKSDIDSKGISLIQTKIHAGKNSNVKIYVAELLGKEFICLNDIGGICEEGAKIELIKADIGAGKLYSGVNIDLKGRESKFETDVAYHVYNTQVVDMNYNAVHHGEKTESLMNIWGTLEEGANKIFRGTIDFKKGSKGAVGEESENVMLLGENVINKTVPLILCMEEDVLGNHGASIGQLDDKVLFYLCSRGIGIKKAKEIITKSRIDAVSAKIPNEEIRSEIIKFEEERRNLYGNML